MNENPWILVLDDDPRGPEAQLNFTEMDFKYWRSGSLYQRESHAFDKLPLKIRMFGQFDIFNFMSNGLRFLPLF